VAENNPAPIIAADLLRVSLLMNTKIVTKQINDAKNETSRSGRNPAEDVALETKADT
jgi:hypothetical protein